MLRDEFSADAGPLLLVRPQPKTGESWGGYLLRLVRGNEVRDIGALTSAVGLSLNEALVAGPSAVLVQFGISWQGVPSDLPLWRSSDERRLHLARSGRSTRSRICPHCIAEDKVKYARAAWDCPMSISCERHNVMMIDRCSACHRHLTLFRRDVATCACGADLCRQAADMTPSWVLTLRKVFAEAYRTEVVETFSPAQPLAQEAARVCNWLATEPDSATNRRPPRTIDRNAFLTSGTAARLGPLFQNWPSSTATVLKGEVRRGGRGAYVHLCNRLRVDRFDEMRTVVRTLKVLVQPEVQALAATSATKRATQRLVRDVYGIKDLMKATGHSHTALVASIDAGELPGASYQVSTATGCRAFAVTAEAYRMLEAQFKNTTTVDGAAEQLGCSSGVIRALVRGGRIKVQSLLQSGLHYRIDPRELSAVSDELFAHATFRRSNASVDRIYLSAWVTEPVVRLAAIRWATIMANIRAGSVKIFSACKFPSALNDLYMFKSDLRIALIEPAISILTR